MNKDGIPPCEPERSQVEYPELESIKKDPRIGKFVPLGRGDRETLWESLDQTGNFDTSPLVVTSDDYLVDGAGRLEWAEKNGLTRVPVIVRRDLSFLSAPDAVELLAIDLNDRRRQLNDSQRRKLEKRRKRLSKALARQKMSEGGKRGAEMTNNRKPVNLAATEHGDEPRCPGSGEPCDPAEGSKCDEATGSPRSGEPRSRAKPPGQENSNETLRQSQRVEEAWKAGALPVGKLEDQGIVSPDLAHRVLKAEIDPEVQKAIIAEVEKEPVEKQHALASKRLNALLPKKTGKNVDKAPVPHLEHLLSQVTRAVKRVDSLEDVALQSLVSEGRLESALVSIRKAIEELDALGAKLEAKLQDKIHTIERAEMPTVECAS